MLNLSLILCPTPGCSRRGSEEWGDGRAQHLLELIQYKMS